MAYRHRTLFAGIAAAVMLTAACGTKEGKATDKEAAKAGTTLPGDSMVYGLACDGCNDTILVLLRLTGEDPDTFDILDAWKGKKVFGRPETGDNLAVMLNEDGKAADLVVDIDKLKGEWCYTVKSREFGLEIKSEHIARPIGTGRNWNGERTDSSDIPPQKRYREWHLLNGRLLLSETTRDTTGVSTVVSTDTAQFVLLEADTMALRFSDGTVQGLYRGERLR